MAPAPRPNWKEYILRSQAARARPEVAQELMRQAEAAIPPPDPAQREGLEEGEAP